MDMVVVFVGLEVWSFLIGLLAIVIYKIYTGEINFRGVLCEKIHTAKTRRYSVVRVQLMIFVVVSAFYYVSQVIENPTEFPPVPNELLLALGGSQMVYLAGKSYSFLSLLDREKRKGE
ncbi:MAG: hypothetical protein ACUBOA_13925 [Candidatus Loosdrechtia sp.]|uniref:hypothetical protein n=1 Tax=Candidatus Loosdrechtia sp. TaxID=3101272 RepID=UPI003A61BC77|nr:MAG: hypothetical protein QY305_05855 [Candidatus Jettenia sp. AMX2]